MTILSSTNTGTYKILKEYLDKILNCPDEYSYEIKKSPKDNIPEVYIKSFYACNKFTIDAEKLPTCRIFFNDNCSVFFKNFKTLKDYEKINFNYNFVKTLYYFLFYECIFPEELSRYLIDNKFKPHIKKSVIYFSEEKLQNVYLNHYRDINIQSALKFLKKENEVIENNIDKS
jgi:hypothetical protein